MRRAAVCLTPVLALLMAAASTSEASSHHKSPPKCPPRHPHLIAADAQAQVYLVSEGAYEALLYRGCAYGRLHSYVVGGPGSSSSSGGAGTENLVLAGPIVAREEFNSIGSTTFDQGKNEYRVVVTDVRNGRVLHSVPTGTPNPPDASLVGNGRTTSIVVKSDGAVAWIVPVYGLAQPPEYQIHALDKSGNRLLASGVDIGPASLALGGSTLYWTQGASPSLRPCAEPSCSPCQPWAYNNLCVSFPELRIPRF